MTERGIVSALAVVSYFGGLAWMADKDVPPWYMILVIVFGSILGIIAILAAAARDLDAAVDKRLELDRKSEE